MAAGTNEGGHYFMAPEYNLAAPEYNLAAPEYNLTALVGTVAQNPIRVYRKVSNFCMGS